MKKIIITIDGHSACGKSTLAKQLAEKLKYGFVDTGAMYRAVTYYFLENRVNVQKTREVSAGLEKIDIHFKSTVGGNRTFLNGVDVEDTIRKMFVSKSVSHVAAMSAVRKKVVKQQQDMGKQKGIVMEGRDIGTVVFPKAELKVFLTANEEVRTQRRFNELKAKGQKVTLKTIKKNLKDRDHLDSTRKDSPLKQAEEAIRIDNSNLTQKEQLAMVLALANERIAVLNKVKPKPIIKKPAASKTRPTANKTKAKPASAKNKPASKSKPNKPQPRRAAPTNKNKSTPTRRTKPNTQKKKAPPQKAKPNQQKSNNQQTRNNQRPVQKKTNGQQTARNQKVKTKPTPKKTTSKPQRKQHKSNNTSTNNKKPVPQKRHQSRKPKQNTKKKHNIEDLLDDFSF